MLGSAVLVDYNEERMLFEHIPHLHYIWLVAASTIAGVMNAMAGGGSFLSFPAMLGMGVPPVQANATNTVALWPGQLTSLATLRGDVRKDLLPTIAATCVLGGVLGAEVLLHTRQRTFLHMIPWLILGGTVIFGISGPVSKWLRKRAKHVGGGAADSAVLAGVLAVPGVLLYWLLWRGRRVSGDDDPCAVWHGEDAHAERDEGGCGDALEPVRDYYVHLSGRDCVALLRGVDGVCGAGRMGGSAICAAREWRCAARDCGCDRAA